MLKYVFMIYICIVAVKILASLHNINYSRISIKFKKNTVDLLDNVTIKNILILIPVLREQSIITKTMDHFKKFAINGVCTNVIIAGTNREQKINGSPSTKEIVLKWINSFKDCASNKGGIQYYFFEADDSGGDRATQLNFSVNEFKRTIKTNIDLIGVYDADSLPNINTLISVINSYNVDSCLSACQQPVHFVDASNEMAKNKVNPILVANAVYQSTWTMIRELPMWLRYYGNSLKSKKIYKRNVYLIGHGQFIKYKDYVKFRFPEHEVTDGIQLGYRLGMSNKSIMPLLDFCSDDAPREISQLIHQHKRWFGGCMRLKEAYLWSRDNFHTRAIFQMLDGFWSQFSWAWAGLVTILLIILGLIYYPLFSIIIASLALVYCYVIPLIAHRFLPVKIKIRFVDWLCLPLAIVIKGIGPNIYLIEKLFLNFFLKKDIIYRKVERTSVDL